MSDENELHIEKNEQSMFFAQSAHEKTSNLMQYTIVSTNQISDEIELHISENEQPNFLAQSAHEKTSNFMLYDESVTNEISDENELQIEKNEQPILNNESNESNEQNLATASSTEKHQCICGNKYKYQRSLLRHKLTCNPISSATDIQTLTNLVMEVVKQNKELMTQQFEVQKQNQELTTKLVEMTSKSSNNMQINHINHHNNHTFNLNVFLNEQCKDAMNIMDFVDSLQIQLSDLEDIGKHGFVEAISNLIVRNLKALDVTQRPIHCADKKREILYVKDEDKWEKENDERVKIRKAIKRVATKNQKLLQKFKEKHPGCNFSDSKFANQYSKLVIEVMDDNNIEKQDKIIRKIANEVVIDKRYQ